jgi:hypothetical protein
LLPWREVAVDLIGPWTSQIGNQKHRFIASAMIDMVTDLVEVVRIVNKTAAHVALHFENTWLSRHPRPIHLICDQGGEFAGCSFQNMSNRLHIHRHPISAKKPQAKSVCERKHQTIGNPLRALSAMDPPAGMQDALQLVDAAITNAVIVRHRNCRPDCGCAWFFDFFLRALLLGHPFHDLPSDSVVFFR